MAQLLYGLDNDVYPGSEAIQSAIIHIYAQRPGYDIMADLVRKLNDLETLRLLQKDLEHIDSRLGGYHG